MKIPNNIKVSIVFIVVIVLFCIILELLLNETRYCDMAELVVLAFTLIALIIYAWDTHRIANATEQKWEEELKPKLQYDMGMNPNNPSDVIFKLINQTDYLIEAKINCNLKIYGDPITFSGAYDGLETWRIFPNQISMGHFSLNTVLSKKGKNFDIMKQESTPQNQTEQLSMDLEIIFESENGRKRVYPKRRHYFLFEHGAWVPELTKFIG